MKFYVMDRFSLLTAGMIGLFVLFLCFGTPRAVETAASRQRELPVYSVETDKKTVAVTFDAAWEPSDLDEILNTLREYGVHATFFAVGDWVSGYPEEAKKITAAGHTLASHSMKHTLYTKMDPEEMLRDMDAADAVIAQTVGKAPPLFRAPAGAYDSTVVRTVRDSGREIIQWDCDSLDWKGLSAEEIAERITGKAGNGSILLFHIGTPHGAEALSVILEKLRAEGFSFPAVEDMIYRAPYTLDHTGRQFQKKDAH